MNTHINIVSFFADYESLTKNDLLLDVRSEQEFIDYHIPGALNIDYRMIDKESSKELEKYQRIYVYCRMGGRATKACDTLSSLGFNNITCLFGNICNSIFSTNF